MDDSVNVRRLFRFMHVERLGDNPTLEELIEGIENTIFSLETELEHMQEFLGEIKNCTQSVCEEKETEEPTVKDLLDCYVEGQEIIEAQSRKQTRREIAKAKKDAVKPIVL